MNRSTGNYAEWKLSMKKTVLLFLLLTLPFISLTGETETKQDATVYVTSTGMAYHQDACRFLRQSQIAITLADAVKSGYNPCSTCEPPVLESGFVDNVPQNNTPLYRVNIVEIRNSSAADIGQMVRADVVSHVDGDTVRVRIPNPPASLNVIETIRLLGVDTPETVHPNRDAEFFGQEASDFTKRELLGRNVYLAFDWDLRDRFGRLLAYIYTDDGRCFNARLIYEGFGYALLRFPFQFMDEFRDLESEARREGRGLWGAYLSATEQ